MRSVSSTYRRESQARSTSEAWIALITLTNPALTEPVYITDDPKETLPIAGVKGVESRGIEFIYVPIEWQLPHEDDTGVSRAKIRIDNVDRRIVATVRQAQGDINMKVEVVLASDTESVEFAQDFFVLRNVTYDALSVEADLYVENYDFEPFPYARITPSYFPASF
jgi:hypothetical protein